MLLCPGVYENDAELDGIKTFEEIRTIAKDSNNEHLLWHVDLDEMQVKFWFREYIPIVKLSEKYRNSSSKRSFELLRQFYDGISSFSLARDTGEERWAQIGEECVTFWTTVASLSNWNFENNFLLLLAESSYTKGDFAIAEELYDASILSARQHKFLHEEVSQSMEYCTPFELLRKIFLNKFPCTHSRRLRVNFLEFTIVTGA